MKTKIILLSAISLLSITTVKAQLYAGFGVGYGMANIPTVVGYNSASNNSANTYFNENVKGSFGKGFNINAYAGYKVGEFVGLELGVNYLMGSKYKFSSNDVNGNSTDLRDQDAHSSSLRLNPSIRIGVGEGKIKPYLRGGLTIGMMNRLTFNETRTETNPIETDITKSTFEYTGGTSLGFTGGLGVTIAFGDELSMYIEMTNYFSNWAATKGEFTTYSYNGADQLGSMTTDEKQFVYVDKVDQSMNTTNSSPTSELKSYSPMSSLGLSVGLHFNFGE